MYTYERTIPIDVHKSELEIAHNYPIFMENIVRRQIVTDKSVILLLRK
jgi:hypothetical protein